MSPTGSLLSLGAWYFLPDFVTRQLLEFPVSRGVFSVLTRSSSPRKLYARTFSLVVLSYLLYTLVSSIVDTQPNFYQLLGVTPDVDEAGLKVAFKGFARVWHPDRRGGQGEELFMAMREMYEALKDPVKKFAYDRFGPGVLACQTCSSKRDYIRRGLPDALIHHATTGAFVIGVGMIGRKSPLAFWRWILYLTLFLAEVSLILSPSPAMSTSAFSASPPTLSSTITHPSLSSFWNSLLPWSRENVDANATILLPPTSTLSTLLRILMPARVPYQHIAFLHQLFIFLNLALVRVAPVLLGPQPDDEQTRREEERTILQMTKSLDDQSQDVLRQIMSIIQVPPNVQTTEPPPLTLIKDEMADMIVEGTIKAGLGSERWNTIVQRFFNTNERTEDDPVKTE